MQVVNVDDLEEILGPRPFHSAEMRNIDKFRDGFKKADLVDEPATPPTPSSSDQPAPGVVDVPEAQEGVSTGGIGVEKPGGAGVSGGQTAEGSSGSSVEGTVRTRTGRIVAS